ncbi:hypothetical protein F5Y14DRAFT_455050 [Nemania sp. NC0429]|nr:hypothetical protein F5Y14DRAFT_455050 [Nemania sp. NC0429]
MKDIVRLKQMRFNIDDLLPAHDIALVDGLWIALTAIEAIIILGVFSHRVLGGRKRNATEGKGKGKRVAESLTYYSALTC